jgi:hypothetical protein
VALSQACVVLSNHPGWYERTIVGPVLRHFTSLSITFAFPTVTVIFVTFAFGLNNALVILSGRETWFDRNRPKASTPASTGKLFNVH